MKIIDPTDPTLDPIYRAECGQCSDTSTASNPDQVESWADDHVDKTGHAVSINQVEGPVRRM
jgi:hypothetical protein